MTTHCGVMSYACFIRAYNRGLLPGAGIAVCASGFAVRKLNNVFIVAPPLAVRTPHSVRGFLFV